MARIKLSYGAMIVVELLWDQSLNAKQSLSRLHCCHLLSNFSTCLHKKFSLGFEVSNVNILVDSKPVFSGSGLVNVS